MSDDVFNVRSVGEGVLKEWAFAAMEKSVGMDWGNMMMLQHDYVPGRNAWQASWRCCERPETECHVYISGEGPTNEDDEKEESIMYCIYLTWMTAGQCTTCHAYTISMFFYEKTTFVDAKTASRGESEV